MPKNREDLKILYIQIRDDEVTANEELMEFVRFSELKKEQFTILNTFDTPNFLADKAKDFDAVFVGGSSDVLITEKDKYPFIIPMEKLLMYCKDNDIPVLASCFGFHGAIDMLGGEFIVDEKNIQTADCLVKKTEEAKDDPLFHDAPDEFWAINFHMARAKDLPEEMVLLATLDTAPILGIKIKDKPFYAFQFHLEIDKPDYIARIIRYIDRYHKGGEESGQLKSLIDTCHETPVANGLVKKFVDKILLKQ